MYSIYINTIQYLNTLYASKYCNFILTYYVNLNKVVVYMLILSKLFTYK